MKKRRIELTILKILIVLIGIFLLVKYRLSLDVDVKYDFDELVDALYDTGFYLNNALHFDMFNITNTDPLIKNRAFMWVFLASNYFKIPLNMLVTYFWAVAAILIYLLIKKITNNRIIAFVSFIYVLFNPIAFYSFSVINVYRNAVYIQMLLIMFALFLLYDISVVDKSLYVITILYGLFAGISLFFTFFLDEVGVAYVLSMAAISVIFLIYYLYRQIQDLTLTKIIKKTVVLSLPFLIFIIGVSGYKYVNYRVYGISVINNRTEGEIGKFVSLVQNIESPDTDYYIWCSFDQLMKARDVSETFTDELCDELCNSPVAKSYGNEKGIHGDFLGWAIHTTTMDLSLKEKEEMYGQINKELEAAFESGLLRKTYKTRLTKTSGAYSNEEIEYVTKPIYREMTKTLISYDNLDEYVTNQTDNVDKDGEFLEFFHIDDSIKYDESHIDTKKTLVSKYQRLTTPILFTYIINILIILYILFNTFFKRKKKVRYTLRKNSLYVLTSGLAIAFLILFYIYSFSISWFLTWVFHDIDKFGGLYHMIYFYGGRACAFLIISYLLSVSALVMFILPLAYKLVKKLYHKVKTRISWNGTASFKKASKFCEPFFKNLQLIYERLMFIAISIVMIILIELVFSNYNGIQVSDIKKVNDFYYSSLLNNDTYNKTNYNIVLATDSDINFDMTSIESRDEDFDKYVETLYNIPKNINYYKDDEIVIEPFDYNDVLICGDSYAVGLAYYLNNKMHKNTVEFVRAGRPIIENKELYKAALNTDAKVVILATSVNDVLRQTNLEKFKETIEEIFDYAESNNKILIVHSNVDFKYDDESANESLVLKFVPKYYDEILKRSAKEYDNVIYIDCNDIADFENIQSDGLHYNDTFYSELINKIDKEFTT